MSNSGGPDRAHHSAIYQRGFNACYAGVPETAPSDLTPAEARVWLDGWQAGLATQIDAMGFGQSCVARWWA